MHESKEERANDKQHEEQENWHNELSTATYAKSCAKYSMKGLLSSVTIGIHSVKHLRVNNVLANTPLFAEAFHCAPGAALNPEKRCSIY
ncbi:hypothetical protein RB195_003382 [Necator americanus]|uniref:Peptidase M13 C-terminal domain-containing protein n=1 Tax=Necator americanus TaxID=51031 RepID=A0ABR1DNC0_NECAM